MNITRRIPFIVTFAVCACSFVEPRSTNFGESITLGQDCNELAGTYSNILAFTTNRDVNAFGTGTLEMLFEKRHDLTDRLKNPEFIRLSFPVKGTLRIDKIDQNGGIVESNTLFNSKGEFECSSGALNITYHSSGGEMVSNQGVSYYGNTTDKLSFTITTNKYLEVKVSNGDTGVVFLLFLPVPVSGSVQNWYYYAPKQPQQYE